MKVYVLTITDSMSGIDTLKLYLNREEAMKKMEWYAHRNDVYKMVKRGCESEDVFVDKGYGFYHMYNALEMVDMYYEVHEVEL